MGAKGQPKTGGRKKDTPNKTTAKARTIVNNILTEYSSSGKMSLDFNALDPKDRLAIAEKLFQYVMPKIQSVAVDVADNKKMTIEHRLIELSKEG
jgi:hypothetical protein